MKNQIKKSLEKKKLNVLQNYYMMMILHFYKKTF